MSEVENPEVDRADWALLVPLFPSELTNPQPTLPTAPGHYLDKDGDAWRVYPDGVWIALWATGPEDRQDASPQGYGPFAHLVPEWPHATQAEAEAGAARLWNSERVEVEEEAREFTLAELTGLATAIAAGGDQ